MILLVLIHTILLILLFILIF